MKNEMIHVVFGIYSGIVSEVFLYRNEKEAQRKYNRIRKGYGIRAGEEDDHEHEVKWFEVPFKRGGGEKKK